MTPYNNSTGTMLLQPQVSRLDAYNAGYWSRLAPIPAFTSVCFLREVWLSAEYEYSMSQDESRTQTLSGLLAKVGVGDDLMTELEMSGLFIGGATGMNNASVKNSCDIPYVHATLGHESMYNHCNCDNNRDNCFFFRRPDMPTVQTMRLNVRLEMRIDHVAEKMYPISFSVKRQPLANSSFSDIAVLNETVLIPMQSKLTVPAARWINRNGTTPAPFLFFHSQVANVTVYKVSVSINDICNSMPTDASSTRVPRTTSTVGLVPLPPAITSTRTTVTPSPISLSTTSTTQQSTSESTGVTNNSTQLSEPTMSISNSTNGTLAIVTDADAPAIVIPSALDDFGAANVLIIAVVAILYLCCIGGVCVFRERIAAARCFAKLYHGVPGGRFMFCCCRPTASDDDTMRNNDFKAGRIEEVPSGCESHTAGKTGLSVDLSRLSPSTPATDTPMKAAYVSTPKPRSESLETGALSPSVRNDAARSQYDGVFKVAPRASGYDELRHTEIGQSS